MWFFESGSSDFLGTLLEHAVQIYRGVLQHLVTHVGVDIGGSLVVCGRQSSYDTNESRKNTRQTFGEDYDGGEMDASIVGTQMMYMATELGLGTLWARGYNAWQFHITMGLPEDIRVVFPLDVGYSAENSVNRHTLIVLIVWGW